LGITKEGIENFSEETVLKIISNTLLIMIVLQSMQSIF